jgi:hypothetical protein
MKRGKDMRTTPTRLNESPEIDEETEKIILERLATFEEDVKTTSPWPEVEARIRQKLKTPKTH